MEKPTVLFIHGIWHTPAHWRPIRDLFESNDYETACPALPTSGATESIGLDEDVARITKELDRLVMEEQKEVVIVAHSFGGVASSEATRNEYSRTYREKEGTKGGVKHLVFLCSHLFPEGTPLDQPWPEYMQLNDQGRVIITTPANQLYNDLPPTEQEKWVKEMRTVPESAVSPRPPKYAGWRYIPITYLFCKDDNMIPLGMQEMMVGLVEKEGVEVKKEWCEAGHSPYLSQPETVLRLVNEVVGV